MEVVAFGEIMARLGTQENHRLIQSDFVSLSFGGAEANVLANLSALNVETSFVTVIPNNSLARAAVASLNKCGVATDNIIYGGERLGLYFYENTTSANVIYDRKGSAFSALSLSDIDVDSIFEGAMWFHLSGITPSLSCDMPNICLKLMQAAKQKGIKISLDVNYRSKLWSVEAAANGLKNLLPYVNVLIANEWDAKNIFGFDGLKELIKHHDCICAHSDRTDGYSGVLMDGKAVYRSKKHYVSAIERIGTGDAFAAGIIFSAMNGFDYVEAIEFAAACGAVKQGIKGDYSVANYEEIISVVEGKTSIIKR